MLNNPRKTVTDECATAQGFLANKASSLDNLKIHTCAVPPMSHKLHGKWIMLCF